MLLRCRPHVSRLNFRRSLPFERLVIELKRGMASDRGQNRYSLFMAPQRLLRFENCSSSYCLLSSWRRFYVFESSFPSFVSSYCFLRAPLAFLRVVKFFFRYNLSSRRRNGLVSSLRHFQVLTSSVLLFVYWATYKTAMSQLFPPSLHEAPPGQKNMVKKVTEVVSISKDALAKIENKSEEQQPSTP